MIGRLRGELIYKHPPQLLMEVHGVGYEVEAPMSTFYDLPAEGATVTLLTHMVVRDDAQALYGFASERERGLFRSLIKVTGVGPRMALAILSGMNAARFAECIRQENVTALVRVPGVGRKTAERLIVELRDRLEGLDVPPAQQVSPAPSTAGTPALADAIGALVALGYKPAEASRMARAADDGRSTEEIIRAALKAAGGP